MAENFAPCPMCGESIAVGSRKCPSCGEALAAGKTPRKWTFNLITLLSLVGIIGLLVALLLPAQRRSRPASRRSQCKNNLKQIELALLNYQEAWHALPPAYTVDANGKPLHSWRTLILPFLDQAPLYRTIDLSKPWDDPVNADAMQKALPVYQCPSNTASPPNHTTYFASVGPKSFLRLAESRDLSEITDGRSETLTIIEAPADRSVPWMSPHDADEVLVLSIGPKSKLSHQGGSHAALLDGSVRFFPDSIPAATRRALISVAGGDNVGEF
jgi:type II secretory pathway pseudopilin PulG